ncbi:hypothetical protein RhiJN_28936 [Ceratobasidium sp. AG-Ba]|nr:hypothetical protein RhiJN_14906 [Ceratobasidium sp. AG-Ba]QRW00918.1 hypothetical protein RhiJN_28936 [Ceratobasidium sp. AG-Ba]QRW15446.1 hypothetical protein RhiLY_14445 [Ceratobasidium sp. AG-Ba]
MRLDYAAFTYLAVTLSPQSPHFTNPNALAARTAETIQGSGVQHVGKVGELDDVQLFSVPKNVWDSGSGESSKILEAIRAQEGVKGVDVQVPRTRAKRGGEL